MDIILDTNIFRSDFLRRGADFEVLKDYLKKTDSSLIIPRIVLDEITNLFKRDVEKHVKDVISAQKKLDRLGIKTKSIEGKISPITLAEQYRDNLLKEFDLEKIKIPEYSTYSNAIETFVRKSLNREAPMHKKDSFRDTLLWLSVIERAKLLKKANGESLVFISSNTAEFVENGVLHDDLLQEINKLELQVFFFSDLRQFIKKHATVSGTYDIDWISANLNLALIDDDISQFFSQNPDIFHDQALLRFGNEEQQNIDVLSVDDVGVYDVEIEDCYSYLMADGSYKVYVRLYFSTVASIEVEDVVYNAIEKEYEVGSEVDQVTGEWGATYVLTVQNAVIEDYALLEFNSY